MMNQLGLGKMFGRIEPGMCRLSMSGGIAVKTSNGYKSYNVKKNKLTNCSNFVFDIGADFFFLIPTNNVEVGDIILVHGSPRCVISKDENTITAINYENSVVETLLPERHVFMGNTYFYGKIVSMFGSGAKKSNMMKYYMMSQMFKGGNSVASGGASNMFGGVDFGTVMAMGAMFGGGNVFGDMFSGLFNEDVFSDIPSITPSEVSEDDEEDEGDDE